MPEINAGNGVLYGILAIITGLTIGIRTAGPAVLEIIREWRRPDNADFKESVRLRNLLARVYRAISGTPAYDELGEALKDDLEREFK